MMHACTYSTHIYRKTKINVITCHKYMNLYTRCTTHMCVCMYVYDAKKWNVELFSSIMMIIVVVFVLCCIYYCFGTHRWWWWWLYISGMIILSSQKTLFVYVLLYDLYVFVIFVVFFSEGSIFFIYEEKWRWCLLHKNFKRKKKKLKKSYQFNYLWRLNKI